MIKEVELSTRKMILSFNEILHEIGRCEGNMKE